MSGLLGLLFGTGSRTAKENTDEEKYAVVESERDRESTSLEAEYSEIDSRHPTLMSKMFGGSYIERTPEEEKAIHTANQKEELKKERKRQAEAEKQKEFDKQYKEAVVKERAARKARRAVRQAARRSRVRPFTSPDYGSVFIPAFGMRRSSNESTSVSYSKYGVYPYDLVMQPVSNTAKSFVVMQSPQSSGRLSNPLFDMFSGNIRHSKGKGVHPLSSFGFV